MKQVQSLEISSLEISALNYEVAWNLLKEGYDNKRVIIQNHVAAILDTVPNEGKFRRVATNRGRCHKAHSGPSGFRASNCMGRFNNRHVEQKIRRAHGSRMAGVADYARTLHVKAICRLH